MSVKKWRVGLGRYARWEEPKAVMFERETDKFLIDDRGRRTAKRSEYDCYFDSAIEAAEYLRDRFAQHVENAKDRLQGARSAYGQAEAYIERFNRGRT